MPSLKSLSPVMVALLVMWVPVLGLTPPLLRSVLAQTPTTQGRKAEADRLLQQGILEYQSEQYKAATELCKMALANYRVIQDHKGESNALMCLGHIHFIFTLDKNFDSSYQTAVDYYQQALSISQTLKDQSQENNVQNTIRLELSSFVILQADREERKGHYSKALNIRQKVLKTFRQFKNVEGEAQALADLGSLYSSLGQYQTAISYYQQSLEITRQIGDKFEEAKILADLGIENYNLGNYQTTVDFHERALQIYSQIRETDNSIGELFLGLAEAVSLRNLGDVYYKLGQYQTAITSYQRAEELFDQGYPFAAYRANAQLGLGDSYLALAQYNTALDHYHKALQAIRETGKFHVIEGKILSKIGDFHVANRQAELAIIFYKQSINIFEVVRQDIRALPRDLQNTYTQTIESTYRSLADLLIKQGRLPEAQAVLELLQLKELRDYTRDAKLPTPGISLTPAEQKALDQIIHDYTTINQFATQVAQCEAQHCAQLKDLQAQRDQLNAAVRRALDQLRTTLTTQSLDLSQLNTEAFNQKARAIVNAQPGTILIYPLLQDTKLQFLLVFKAGAHAAITFKPVDGPTVNSAELFATAKKLRDQLSTPNSDLKQLQATSQQLYTWLIKPLEAEINQPNVKHLVFASNKTIRYIPLAALYDGKDYLINKPYTLSIVLSATTTEPNAPRPTAPNLLAAGATTFSQAPSLSHVDQELSAIVKTKANPQGIVPGNELLNQQFDFPTLKAQLQGHNFLHIATHGILDPGNIDNSYLLPGQGEPITKAKIQALADYGLSDVHLVVLSACNTAVGTSATGLDPAANSTANPAGQRLELSGISYYFMQGGAKAVIASLWAVNDSSTALIMQRFYHYFAQGQSKAAALRQAQQDLLNLKDEATLQQALNALPRAGARPLLPTGSPIAPGYTHPYYWAPFILIGNGL